MMSQPITEMPPSHLPQENMDELVVLMLQAVTIISLGKNPECFLLHFLLYPVNLLPYLLL